MPGPEWIDHEPGPLSHPDDRDHDPSLARAIAPTPEPDMEPDHDPEDRDESPTPGATQRPGLAATIFSILAKIPRPSLGTERHEILPEPHLPSEAPARSSPAPARPSPIASPARFPGLAMNRETRVGIAAVLSFVLLVTALIVKRSWSGTPVTMAMKGPADGEASTDPKKDAPSKPDDPKVPKDKERESSGPTPGTRPPEPLPADPSGPSPALVVGSGSRDPATLPTTSVDPTTPAILASSLPKDPPALPSDAANTPKPPDPPVGAVDPLPIPGGELPPTTPPSLPAPTEPPADPKPKPTELNPAPAPAPAQDPVIEPPPMNPTAEPGQPPPSMATAPPTLTPESTPAPTPSAGPVPTARPPAFESVSSVEASATKTSTVGSLGAGWVMIPSGGRRIVGAVPIVSTPADIASEAPRVADGPKYADDLGTTDQVEPVVHEVKPGENFWTISKLYYRSGRFYKALHAANRKQVPDIRQLWVGTVLRIPPPEALDRTLIDAPNRSNGDEATTSIVSRTSKRSEPPDDADLAMPVRPRRTRPDPEAPVEAPRRPTYKVKPFETLRGIARDTLNDPRRDREIYNLNRDVLDDINVLPAGTVLTLPEDASTARRAK